MMDLGQKTALVQQIIKVPFLRKETIFFLKSNIPALSLWILSPVKDKGSQEEGSCRRSHKAQK